MEKKETSPAEVLKIFRDLEGSLRTVIGRENAISKRLSLLLENEERRIQEVSSKVFLRPVKGDASTVIPGGSTASSTSVAANFFVSEDVNELLRKTRKIHTPIKLNDHVQLVSVSEKEKMWQNETDPYTGEVLSIEEKVYVIHGMAFLPSTIANSVVRFDGPTMYVPSDAGAIIVQLWSSAEEYKAFLSSLLTCRSQVDEKQAEIIRMKLQAYEKVKQFVLDFEAENKVSFKDFLQFMEQKMQRDNAVSGMYSVDQETAFRAYYATRNTLSDVLRTMLFPGGVGDPSDPGCIASSSRLLGRQISRLMALDVIHESTRSTVPTTVDLPSCIKWVSSKFDCTPGVPRAPKAYPLWEDSMHVITVPLPDYATGSAIEARFTIADLADPRDLYFVFAALYVQNKFSSKEKTVNLKNRDEDIARIAKTLKETIKQKKEEEKKELLKKMYTTNSKVFFHAWMDILGKAKEYIWNFECGPNEIAAQIDRLDETDVHVLFSKDEALVWSLCSQTMWGGKDVPVYFKSTTEFFVERLDTGMNPFPGIFVTKDAGGETTFSLVLGEE